MLLGFTHFSGGQSKTIKIFGLKKFLTKERLTVRILRVNGFNTNCSAVKVI